MNNELIKLSRDVDASIVPVGDKVTLAKGVPDRCKNDFNRSWLWNGPNASR